MQHPVATIVTGWGNGLGTGHVQRMASLATFINLRTDARAFLVAGRKPDFLPAELHEFFLSGIRPGTGCIIRDKRDSSEAEIRELKKIGNVITIDDRGPGRSIADAVIDLLPNPENGRYKKESFIYGYNFIDSMQRIGQEYVRKDLDALLYCGYRPSRETVDFLISCLPRDASCAILHGSGACFVYEGMAITPCRPYAETMLSARVLITHFGIALYEGHVCGCRLACINPTEYHSRLADIAGNDIDAVNLGLMSSIDPGNARQTIRDMIQNPHADAIDPRAVYKKIEAGLEHFYEDISPYFNI
jgi:hypothetical protein